MLYIRADMNETIATGHMMRCLSVADAARIIGEETTFILADNQATGLVKQRGHRTIVLHTQWNHMDAELPRILNVLKEENANQLLIDSYYVTKKYLDILTSQLQTVYIDDRNSFFYPVNGLICYANYWRKFNYPDRYQNSKLFLGAEYIPLRQEFCHCHIKAIKEKAEEVLLLSGGTDPYEVLKNVLDAIDLNMYKKINVVCGRYYNGYDELQKKYDLCDKIHIHQAISNIEDYMTDADIAISAGGTSLYELCACGTPTISYSFADNQLDNVRQFQEDEMIDYAGDVRYENVIKNIIHYLDIYRNDMKLRIKHSRKMQEIVDGKGAFRIVKALKTM